MKKYLKYISFCLVAAVSFTSCDSDDGYLPEPRQLNGYAYLSETTISPFDTNADLKIDLFSNNGVTFQSIEVLEDGQVIANPSASGESTTFNSSVFGDFASGDEFDVRLRSTLSNGTVAEDPFTVSVDDAITLDEDNPTALTLDSLANGAAVTYETFTHSATIDDVSLWLKKNSAGTYVESNSGLSTEGATVNFTDTDYADLGLAVNDTLYYTFRATSGDLSQDAEGEIVIEAPAEEESATE